MILKNLQVSNFRNISKFFCEFEKNIIFFSSPNGTGKTNLLEAILCLCMGKSSRAASESELFNLKVPQEVLVQGHVIDESNLQSKTIFNLKLKPRKTKQLFKNQTKVSINNYLGVVPVIWFGPEDIRIISTSPTGKRKYIDEIFIQLSKEYYQNLKNYEKALRNRNKMLQLEIYSGSEFQAWTTQLVKYGVKLIELRQKFFALINEELGKISHKGRYTFQIKYIPSIIKDEIFDEDLSFRFSDTLSRNQFHELQKKSTLIGPHKDDWELRIDIQKNGGFIDAASFASRGQQRVGLVTLQFAFIEVFRKVKECKPILLLDDIFSELDDENKKKLLDFIQANQIQTFMTGVSVPIPEFSGQEINLTIEL